MKSELAKTHIRDFFTSMKQLGFCEEEILELVTEAMKKETEQ